MSAEEAPQEADLFTLPLLDGGTAWGQVVRAREAAVLVALTTRRGSEPIAPLDLSDVQASISVPPAPFVDGHWPVHGFEALPRPREPLEASPAATSLQEPAVAEALASALMGLLPWDYFPQNGFFDSFLLPGRARPADAQP